MTVDGTGEPATITPENARLLVDTMLGKLAVYLRMCGYDAAYVGDREADEETRLRDRAQAEGRLLLSRDARLVEATDAAVRLDERDVESQLRELRDAGVELALADPPTRCGRCNGRLETVPDEAERPDYAPAPDEFDCWRCSSCGQFFWKGSHWDRVRARLGDLG